MQLVATAATLPVNNGLAQREAVASATTVAARVLEQGDWAMVRGREIDRAAAKPPINAASTAGSGRAGIIHGSSNGA
jgi:hypothetical protein